MSVRVHHPEGQEVDHFIKLELSDRGVRVLEEDITGGEPLRVRGRGKSVRGGVRTRGSVKVMSSERPSPQCQIRAVIQGIIITLEVALKENGQFWITGNARRDKEKLEVAYFVDDERFLGQNFSVIPKIINQLIVGVFEREKVGVEPLCNVSMQLEQSTRSAPLEVINQIEESELVEITERSWEKCCLGTLEWRDAIENSWPPTDKKKLDESAFPRLICGTDESPLQNVAEMIQEASQTDRPVLILGETGTGKELVARAIHLLSARRARRFVDINMGAVKEESVHSELFGHVRGAYTGAHANRPGLFKEADGGTIFLDEIGTMPVDIQTTLLRVLESDEIRPLGTNKKTRVDVRVVAATNENLERLIEAGGFRRDLYYRLSIHVIHLPPLRKRRNDIPALIEYFSSKFGCKLHGKTTYLKDLFAAMIWYDWPGNVRQLENFIEVHQQCKRCKQRHDLSA